MSRRWRAAAAAAIAVMMTMVVGAQPASAHTVTGVMATNYRSEITSVSPSVAGLHVRLLDLGRQVQLTNRGRVDVVVLGYFGEPYLRVGPAGVFQNRRSPAVYQNKVLPPGVTSATLPPLADATAAPSWDRVSEGHTVRWRDRRTRWEGPNPPEVAAKPASAHVVTPLWTVDLRRGDAPVVVSGRIDWIPGPPLWGWLGLAVVLFALTLAMAFARRWGLLLSLALSVLVGTDVVHSFASAAVSGDSVAAQIVKVVLGGIVLSGAWIIGVLAVDGMQRQRESAPAAAGIAALVVVVYSGIGDGATLIRSQVPFAFSADVARAAVATSLGIGLGLIGACIVIERRIHGEPDRGRTNL